MLFAFVFMPEHVHLLVRPLDRSAQLSRLLALTKQPTTTAIKRRLVEQQSRLVEKLTVRERPGKYCFRFWQEGPGFDRNLFSPQAIEASIDYIQANPVKRGLCQRSVDWKWSSARFCQTNEIDPSLPTLSKLPPEWLDQSGVQTEHG